MPQPAQQARAIIDEQLRHARLAIQYSDHTHLDAAHGVTVWASLRFADLQALASAIETFQTPPDLVVKFQRFDIVDIIFRWVLRPHVVYQREIKGGAALTL